MTATADLNQDSRQSRKSTPFWRHLGTSLLTVLTVALLVFLVFRVVANPATTVLGADATPEQIQAFDQHYGFDRPIHEQLWNYLVGLVSFDLGESLTQRRPTAAIVAETLPRTLQLIALSLTVAVVIGLAAGTLAATRPNSPMDTAISVVGFTGVSVPPFWSGLILIVVFAVTLGWFPTSGYGTGTYIVLPAIAIGLPHLARVTMITRSTMIDELNRQWIRAARARGFGESRVLTRHAFRNALIPISTVIGWEIITAIAGTSILVEIVFGWPGLGYTLIGAILGNDIFLVQTIAITIAVIVVVVNFLVDVCYRVVDPRIET